MNNYVFEKVTNEIIADLERGNIPWIKPFVSGFPLNYATDRQYTGWNSFLLGHLGYSNPYWMSFKQCASLGGRIKKGAKAMPILGYFETEDAIEKNGKTTVKKELHSKVFYVFNYDQTEGLENKHKINPDAKPIEECEKIVNDMPNRPEIKTGSMACYIPPTDTVEIPQLSNFLNNEGYYDCLFHELGHSTGHASRLDRESNQVNKAFGSQDYSKEELIAEFTSAFICSKAGIRRAVKDNQSAYIKSWLKALKNDRAMLIQSASQAQKAYNYILNVK